MALGKGTRLYTFITMPPLNAISVIVVSAPAGESPSRLTARTGSLSAKLSANNQGYSHSPRSLSRLTIIRMPVLSQASLGTTTSLKNWNHSTSIGRIKSTPVISFASATFTKPDTSRLGSQNSVSRTRSSVEFFDRLSPGQVFDIAKKASQPNSPPGVLSTCPSFLSLTDDIILPFINRTLEIDALFSNRRNATFLKLFGEIFSPDSQVSQEHSTAELFASPDTWSFRDFECWLFRITREKVKDLHWCFALQAAILPRSAVLWERLKALLGIPPEITAVTVSSIPTLQPGTRSLNITPILPMSFGAVSRLSENPEESSRSMRTRANDQILGLRISNILSPILSSPGHLAPSRSRSLSHLNPGFVPLHRSLLVPRTFSAPNRSNRDGNIKAEQLDSRVPVTPRTRPQRENVFPRFPASFDRLTFRSLAPSVE